MSPDKLQQSPFLRLLFPLAAGIACGGLFPCECPQWSAGAGLLLLGVLIVCHWRHYGLAFGIAAHLLLFGGGFWLTCRQWQQTAFDFPGQPAIYKIRIQEKPEEKARSILCRSIVLETQAGDSLVPGNTPHPLFLLYFPKDSVTAKLKRGDELLVHTRLEPPTNNGNPDEFDYARYLRRKGGSGTAYVANGHWKTVGHHPGRTLRQRALDYREKIVATYRQLGFTGDELAVLSALTVGDKEELSDDIIETYSVSGASHVLALSGLHIGFLYALFWFLFRPLWHRWQRLKPMFLLVIVLFLWGFAFLTGLSPSVVRSVIMFSLLALSNLQPEKPLTLNTLAATAFLMLLYNPFWLFDVGFQLSFTAVAAILLIQPGLYALLTVKNRLLRYLWGIATVSVAAQIGTAPLVLLYFSRFSTHFLLTNLWVIPMVSLIMYAAVILLVLTPLPALQQLWSTVVERMVSLQNNTLRAIEALPGSSIDNVWVDVWEVALFYLALLLLYRTVCRCTARNLCMFLISVLALSSLHTAYLFQNTPQRSLMFYNIRGCPAVHCLADNRLSWLVCADSLPDTSRLQGSLANHWNRLRLYPPQTVSEGMPHENKDTHMPSPVFLKNGIASYAGKRICFLQDNRWNGKTSSHKLTIDYLYICKGYKGDLSELSGLFHIRSVVFDASYTSTYYRKRITDTCRRRGISYISPSEQGALRILL